MSGALNNEKLLQRSVTKSVLWNFLGQGCILLISFFATPFILHKLDVNLYGIYMLVGAAMGYLGFLQLGLGPASVKYIAEYLAKKQELKIRSAFWSCIAIYLVLGICAIFAVFCSADLVIVRFFKIAPVLSATAVLALKLGALEFLVTMISAVVSGIMRSLNRFDTLNRIDVSLYALQIGLSVIVLFCGFSLPALIAVNICVKAAGILVYWSFACRYLPFLRKPYWETNSLRELLKFGGFITVSQVLSPILNNVEKIFLSSLRSVASLAYYSIPASLIARASVIPYSFSSVLFPIFSYSWAEGNKRLNQELHYRSSLYIIHIYAFFMVFFLVFGESFLTFWVGREFAEKSAGILAVIAVSGLFSTAAYPSLAVLQGMGRPVIPAVLSLLEVIIYLPCSYFLIGKFGTLGAAYVWLARVFVDMFFLQRASCRLLGQSLWLWYINIIRRSMLPVGCCFVLFYILRKLSLGFTSPANILGILCVLMVYLMTVWLLGLDKSERQQIAGIAKSVFTPHPVKI
jgi:O-antigen/teichoic acid export membrane protein